MSDEYEKLRLLPNLWPTSPFRVRRRETPGSRYLHLMADRYQAGASLTEIAQEFSMGISTVRYYLIRAGVKLRTHHEAAKFAAPKISNKTTGMTRGPWSLERRQKFSEFRRGKDVGLRLIDLTGERFGRLKVLQRSFAQPSPRVKWLCQCDCGNTKIVSSKLLRKGDTKSCGCLAAESASKRTSLVLDGQRFGRWIVVERVFENPNGQSRWLCRCDCGKTKVVLGTSLKQGRSQSCGCLKSETTSDRNRKEIRNTDNPLYRLWAGMIARCSYPDATGYERYGGRGIKVCERWKVFENFVADIPPRPGPEHSIHRNNDDKDYEPGNVYWATPKEQALARKLTRFAVVDGITDSVESTARRVGISATTLRTWMKRGLSPQQIVNNWRTRADHSMKGLLCQT